MAMTYWAFRLDLERRIELLEMFSSFDLVVALVACSRVLCKM